MSSDGSGGDSGESTVRKRRGRNCIFLGEFFPPARGESFKRRADGGGRGMGVRDGTDVDVVGCDGVDTDNPDGDC